MERYVFQYLQYFCVEANSKEEAIEKAKEIKEGFDFPYVALATIYHKDCDEDVYEEV